MRLSKKHMTGNWRARQQENDVAKRDGGKRQPASGALPTAKEDVKSDMWLTSCKTTGAEQYVLRHQDWRLLCERASKCALFPKMEIRFEDKGGDDLVVLNQCDFDWMLHEMGGIG